MFKKTICLITFVFFSANVSANDQESVIERERLLTAVGEVEYLIEYITESQKQALKNKRISIDYDLILADLTTFKNGLQSAAEKTTTQPKSKVSFEQLGGEYSK